MMILIVCLACLALAVLWRAFDDARDQRKARRLEQERKALEAECREQKLKQWGVLPLRNTQQRRAA